MTDITKSKCNIIYIVSSVNVCMICSAPEKEVKFAFGLNMMSDIYKAELNGFGYSPRYIVEQIKYKISFNYTL